MSHPARRKSYDSNRNLVEVAEKEIKEFSLEQRKMMKGASEGRRKLCRSHWLSTFTLRRATGGPPFRANNERKISDEKWKEEVDVQPY